MLNWNRALLCVLLSLSLGCASKASGNNSSDDIAQSSDTSKIDDLAPAQDELSVPLTDLFEDKVEPNQDPVWESVEVKACSTQGAGTQSCFFTYRYDPLKCGSAGCSRLMVYFAGGLNTCPDPANESAYLGKIAKMGFVTVCARIYEDSKGSAEFPYHLEAERVDALLLAITSHPKIQSAWSGKHLLLTGVSHGATAPVTAMARTALDSQTHWRGTGVTGACFLDGIYDLPKLMNFLYDNQCKAPVSYERIYTRYCPWTAGNSQDPSSWPKPESCVVSGVINDSITEVPGSEYAVDHWKLIECGSAADPCTADIIPAEPIESLCSQIDGEPGKSCEYKSFKSANHITCGSTLTNAGACWQWFNALIQAQ